MPIDFRISEFHEEPGLLLGPWGVSAPCFRVQDRVGAEIPINAGDPGGHSPDDLVLAARAAGKVLKRLHPNAKLWICPQDWVPQDYARWLELAVAISMSIQCGGFELNIVWTSSFTGKLFPNDKVRP